MSAIKQNNLNSMANQIYQQNVSVGWWSKEDRQLYGSTKIMLVASKIALIHSEVSEALEGVRKNIKDDHLPERDMVEVELADTIIRILDLAGYLNLDLAGAVAEKFEYNKHRADHKLENRNKQGGKAI